MSNITNWKIDAPKGFGGWNSADDNAIAVLDAPVEFLPVADQIEIQFSELTEQWMRETGDISSITKRAMHPAYQRIIGLGPAALPMILAELETRPDLWFHALRAVSGIDPVRPEQRGRMRQMVNAWLEWGRQQGHLPLCS